MSYAQEDAAADEFYEQLSRELYPEHKEQAIAAFTAERLRSYYLKNPDLAINGRRTFRQAKELYRLGYLGPALVSGVTVIEVFIKAGFLRPVIHGLVHNDSLADVVVNAALSRSGFVCYDRLLKRMYHEIVGKDLDSLALRMR